MVFLSYSSREFYIRNQAFIDFSSIFMELNFFPSFISRRKQIVTFFEEHQFDLSF